MINECFFFRCQIDIIKLLLERGAQLNCQADNGRTPLHVAVLTRNCDECLTLLIKSGCDVNKQVYIFYYFIECTIK